MPKQGGPRAKYKGPRQSFSEPPTEIESNASQDGEGSAYVQDGEGSAHVSQANLQKENEELMQENAELERRLNELEAEGGLGTTSIRRGRGRGAYSGGSFDYSAATPIRALAQYKQGTLKALPTDTPALNEDVDVCLFRAHVLHHFGVWSWLLRRAALEQSLQTDLQKRSYEGKWQRFVSDHVQGSLEMIQNDMYHILSTYFKQFTLTSSLTHDVSGEEDNAGTRLWNRMLMHFDPNRPQLLALMYAKFAEILVKGPSNNFSAWDTNISRSINSLQELCQLDCLMA